MARQANGAAAACAAALTGPIPRRRGKPLTSNGSNGYPASATSRASTRSGDPANVTSTPRPRSASAIASAGSTWPAVPPAAIRHRSELSSSTGSDVKEDPDASEHHHEAGAPCGDEGERNSGQRRDSEDGGEVDGRLAADERRERGGEALAEGVRAAQGDLQPRVGERAVGGDHERRADQPELLADDREDHVGVRLREVEDLLDALTEPLAEQSPRAEADERLHGLEAGALRIVPRVHEAQDPRASVGLDPDRGDADGGGDRRGGAEQSDRRAGHKQQTAEHHDDADHRPEVRLQQDEGAEDAGDETERPRELSECLRRATSSEVGGRPDGERELGELGRLEDGGAEREPATSSVDRVAEREHRHAQDEGHDEERRRELAPHAKVGAGGDREQADADQRIDAL